ncbi:MAG: hypothetical protein GWP08_03905 [Nitrospiraceae bacterium]|nr:hypothetical protein [Nitrospiraceae bacterium]
MSDFTEVVMPQLGVNDTEAIIVEWNVAPGDRVELGQVLAEVETTKATFELECESPGHFYPLAAEGEKIPIRAVIGLILPEASPGVVDHYRAGMERRKEAGAEAVDAPRLTAKARKLVEQHGVELSQLPADRIVRERDVLAALGRTAAPAAAPGTPRRVVVYGASQGGLAVVACLSTMPSCEVVAFLDDAPERIGTMCHGIPVWPGTQLEALADKGVTAVATHIADGALRLALLERTGAAGLSFMNTIHANATVASTVRMGMGNLIKAGAVIDAYVEIGDCCIVDNGVILPHHNRIGDACHLAPGACFGGNCDVGDGTIVGIGATVSARIRIGRNVIIGPGACVLRDVPDDAIVEGYPGKIVGQRKKPGGS